MRSSFHRLLLLAACSSLGAACTGDVTDSGGQSDEAVTGTTSVSFQNGVAPSASYAGGHDTMVEEATPTTNYGSAATLTADRDYPDGTGKSAEMLLSFDVASIPAGSTVKAATLTLNVTNATSGSGYELYKVLRSWQAGTATWNVAQSGSSWSSAGARGTSDRSGTALASVLPTKTGSYVVTLNAAGVAAVQAWVKAPSSNFGFILDAATDKDGLGVDSIQATTGAHRPKLTVSYVPPASPPTPDAGTPTPVPDGGSGGGTNSPYGAGSAPVGSPCSSTAHSVTASMTSAELQSVLNNAGNGAYICFQAGAYRLTTALSPKQGQTLHGSAGSVLKGSVVLGGFSASGSIWTSSNVPLATSGPEAGAAKICEADTTSNFCGYEEDVFYDGKLLTRVLSQGEVTTGKYYVNYGSKTLYLGSNPSGHTVEIGHTDAGVRVGASGVTVEGLTFEMYAHGFDRAGFEVTANGVNAMVRNVESRYSHGMGFVSWGANTNVSYSRFHDNGALGGGISLNSNCTVTHNDFIDNNTDGFWRIDGASGGFKIDLQKGCSITWNRVYGNLDHGIWMDDNSDDVTVANNDIENNWSCGIQEEISSRAAIKDNIIKGNGLGDSKSRGHVGCTGLGCSAGIMVSTSADVEVSGNVISGNSNAISILSASRTPRNSQITIPSLKNANVHDNSVTLGSGAIGLKNQGPSGFDPYSSSNNNRFTSNDYQLTSLTAASFYWENASKNATQWKDYGEDVGGTFVSP